MRGHIVNQSIEHQIFGPTNFFTTKHSRVMNNSLQPFLLVLFEENKCTNIRKFSVMLHHKTTNSRLLRVLETLVSSTMAIKLRLIILVKKLTVRDFHLLLKTLKCFQQYSHCLKLRKNCICRLGFSCGFSIWLCLYHQLWFKQMYTQMFFW